MVRAQPAALLSQEQRHSGSAQELAPDGQLLQQLITPRLHPNSPATTATQNRQQHTTHERAAKGASKAAAE